MQEVAGSSPAATTMSIVLNSFGFFSPLFINTINWTRYP